jgi:FkbM family methyltransferase
MNIRELCKYISWYGVVQGLKTLLSFYVLRKFEPHAKLTYSHVGEDRILNFLFQDKTGYYVEVGCNHPKKASNTFLFYNKGWRGISIDAHAEMIELQKKERNQDISIMAAISNVEKEVEFTSFVDSMVSSIDEGRVEVANQSDYHQLKAVTKMTTVTLNSILKKNKAPTSFDFLLIDVEGHDFNVLKSIDLNIYRPKLIMIEVLNFDLENASANEVVVYLKSKNYKLIGQLIFNCFFLEMKELNKVAF